MSKKQILIRTTALSVAMALIASVLCLRLVYLQLAKGDEYRETAARQTSVRYTITASRGEILDRNGQAMVSNELSYAVKFDYFSWDREKQNDVILDTCAILTEEGFLITTVCP